MFPRAVAQASASSGPSAITVQTSLAPSDTEWPTLADEEHTPTTPSVGPTAIANGGTLPSPVPTPTATRLPVETATSPPLSTTTCTAPSASMASATQRATAPATAAMGPTPALREASHILRTTSPSPSEGSYGE